MTLRRSVGASKCGRTRTRCARVACVRARLSLPGEKHKAGNAGGSGFRRFVRVGGASDFLKKSPLEVRGAFRKKAAPSQKDKKRRNACNYRNARGSTGSSGGDEEQQRPRVSCALSRASTGTYERVSAVRKREREVSGWRTGPVYRGRRRWQGG